MDMELGTKNDELRSGWTDGLRTPSTLGPNREDDDVQTVKRLEGTQTLARGLGWFSLGLGLSQLVAPRALCRLTGTGDDARSATIMRLCGVRELLAGVGIMMQRRPSTWLKARVAGDVMDLAMLGKALTSFDSEKGQVVASLLAVAGVTALDLKAARDLTRQRDKTETTGVGRNLRVSDAITINRSPEEVYAFWRDFSNLPVFMTHLTSVERLDDKRSTWKVSGPAGRTFSWQAEVVEDRKNEIIAWRSTVGDVQNSGSVRFARAAGDRGTEVRVELHYDPPAGAIGATIAKLFGKEPSQQVSGDLRRLKQVMETGEVVHSDASIHKGRHPARPSKTPNPTGGVR